ncbi:hypothetical protein HMPREF9693_01902 [Klebsiella oxytoca 10-5249]|nr:hypothetical protein HMPREF9693_01902 [Klebsiella oxytoca 10-5249]
MRVSFKLLILLFKFIAINVYFTLFIAFFMVCEEYAMGKTPIPCWGI